jgi:hypothetical protein
VFDYPLDLSQPPSTADNRNSAVVNAFYWCNWMHDRLYDLGFTEAAGNCQQDNFGRGGVGGDAIVLDVQDGDEVDESHFIGGAADGPPNPRIQLGLATGPASAGQPHRDAAFDTEIILHEYTHGLVQRLVGHGSGISAPMTAVLNEGWCEFYHLAMLGQAADALNGNYASSAYFFWLWLAPVQTYGSGTRLQENYYYGVSTYPYSTQLSTSPYTFKDIDHYQADPHAGVFRSPAYEDYPNPVSPPESRDPTDPQGGIAMLELWCVTLWDARANLIAKHGFDLGNNLILRLVTDGMKLGPPNPNFVEARDAILLADRV